MSFLKAFLHFLQMNDISVVFASLWDCVSAWHSAQSNHCLQQGARMETWAFKTCLLPPFSVDTERETSGCHTTCFPCGIELKERGSHAYNAWHPELEIPLKQKRNLFRRIFFLQPLNGAESWRKPEKKCRKIREKFEGEAMRFGAFLEPR